MIRLHKKGLVTLFLLSISERPTRSHVINVESARRSCHGEHDHNLTPKHEQCTNQAIAKEPSHDNPATECCAECCRDVDTSFCSTLRGGQVETPSVALSTPFDLSLNVWKAIFQLFLTTINVLCWYLPLRSKNFSEDKLGLSIANAFSGGVFLSLAFGHLIPESVHGFHGHDETLPYMFVMAGYLLIFFIEKVAFDTHAIFHDCNAICKPRRIQARVCPPTFSKKGNEIMERQNPVRQKEGVTSGRSAVILLGALGVHSVIEMMALGLARSFRDTALLSMSIALHQPAESIALLVAFLKSGMPKNQIIAYLGAFSMMGPLGVSIGMLVKGYAAPIVDAIVIAVVAGTFVYVGATEIIPEEWETQDHKWKKFFSLMSGIISILTITQYTMQFHSH